MELVINVKFSENILGKTTPSLTIKFGSGKEIELTNGVLGVSTISYAYTIKAEDKGTINAVNLKGGDIKDAAGNVTRSKALNVKIGTGSADKLTIKTTVSATTTKVGDKLTFTAEGIGGESGYTYKMVVYNRTTKIWGLVQNFNSNNTITWTAGTEGDREFYIDVKDAAGNVTRSAMMNVKTTK